MFSCHVVAAGLHFLYTIARAKTSEPSRSRSKAATIEELSRGVGKFQEFLVQVEDLGREGFPYLDASKARTELQLRECIRRTFGEKSPEFQEHRHHKLLMDSPENTQQSIALIKTLIATLEQKKLDLQGGPRPVQISPAQAEASPIPRRPQMTLVLASIPTVHMTMTQPAPVTSPPVIMSVAMTTNLDPSSATASPNSSPPSLLTPAASSGASGPQRQIPPTSPPEHSPISPAPTARAMSDAPPHPVAQLAPAPLPTSPQTPQTAPAASLHAGRSQQPPEREPEPVINPTPSAMSQAHEPPSAMHLQPRPSTPISFSQQKSAPHAPQSRSNPVELVKMLCFRFHSVARQLRLRGEYRGTISVEDEVDAQDLLHALLRIEFDDIGTDEWIPSYSEAPRTTFLLNDSRLAVIVKKTCPGLSVKGLTDQLRIDTERYRSHERCTTLLCFIYDPEGRIGNPRGLETNLTSMSESFSIEVLVTPK